MEQVSATGGTTTLVHLEHESKIACMPNMREFHATPYHPNYQRTNETRAVTCPQCKVMPVFRQLQDALSAAIHKRTTSDK